MTRESKSIANKGVTIRDIAAQQEHVTRPAVDLCIEKVLAGGLALAL